MCAYLRATEPSTPSVEATALQPPSMASFTMFSGSKYIGFGANDAPGRMLDPLIDRKNRHVACSPEPAVIDERLEARQHARGPIGRTVAAIDPVGSGQVQRIFRNGLALMLKERGGVRPKDVDDVRGRLLNGHVPSHPEIATAIMAFDWLF